MCVCGGGGGGGVRIHMHSLIGSLIAVATDGCYCSAIHSLIVKCTVHRLPVATVLSLCMFI